MVWSVGTYTSLLSVFKYRYPQFWNTVIQKNVCKTDIFSVTSGFFDTGTAGGAGDKYKVC